MKTLVNILVRLIAKQERRDGEYLFIYRIYRAPNIAGLIDTISYCANSYHIMPLEQVGRIQLLADNTRQSL